MKNFILAASMLFASSQAFAANDSLIVTGEKAKGGTAIAIDYMSSGMATGLQFNIAVPGGDKAKVNLGNCLKSLPSTHGAVCNFAKGQVIGMVFSDTNALLPAGMLSLGTIAVSGAQGHPEIISFVAADAQGNRIPASVELGSDAVENKTEIAR